MKFEIQILDELSGPRASIYSVYLDDSDKTLYDIFLEDNELDNLPELRDINRRLENFGKKYGVREDWIKWEGKAGEDVCAIFDQPNSKLRLYGIRLGNAAILLGNGGEKSKAIRTYQEDPNLTANVLLMRILSKLISEKIKSGEIYWEGIELCGELIFNTDGE